MTWELPIKSIEWTEDQNDLLFTQEITNKGLMELLPIIIPNIKSYSYRLEFEL